MYPGDQVNRRQKGQHAAQTLARAALTWTRQRGQGRVSEAIRSRCAPGFRPGVVPLALFPLVPIKTPPPESEEKQIQSLELYCCFVCRSCSCFSFLLLLVLVLAIRVKERECVRVVFEG